MIVVVTVASVQERDGAKRLFNSLTVSCKKIRRIWVGGGYRGANMMEWVAQRFHIVLHTICKYSETLPKNDISARKPFQSIDSSFRS